MARVTGFVGSVALPSGFNADFSSWDLDFSHPVDDDTSYSDTGTGSSHSGCGTTDYNLAAGGFLKRSVSNSAPGLASITGAGGSCTLTSYTGCTHVGTFILNGGAINHRKRSGAIPIRYTGVNDGDLVETWATS